MQVQLEKINWCTTRSVLRPFEVYWMAIAILILRMLRENNRSPSFDKFCASDASFFRLHGRL